MILIFIGPPYSGKDTQAKLIAKEFGLSIFSMGNLIRQAYEAGDSKAIEGFENYSMKGLHVPISLKFALLKKKMEEQKDGFILDNFPATKEDLDTFNEYIKKNSLVINKVFYLNVSEDEMMKRRVERGRLDDEVEILQKRREEQDKDRSEVIKYFKNEGILKEINTERQSIEETHEEIMKELRNDKN